MTASEMLLINASARKRIKKLADYADANRIPIDVLHKMAMEIHPPAGDDENYVCHLESGYRVVYTIEEQPSGWMRHISISLNEHLPPEQSVIKILEEFGFVESKEGFQYFEKCPLALNFLQEID